jgi:hypothetical protein
VALWLRHINNGVTTSLRIDELALIPSRNVVRKSGTTLRGNTYDHKLHARRVWQLIVSADQTYGTMSAATFLVDFFTASARLINLSTDATAPTTGWIAVALDGGDLPVTYIEDCILLPEFSFKLIEKGTI